jgi:preprotein translocase subunit SecY
LNLKNGANGQSWLVDSIGKEGGVPMWFAMIVINACFCAGASLVMWLAELINERGIGNGISVILCVNIIASFPSFFSSILSGITEGTWWVGTIVAVGVAIVAVAAIGFIVFVTNSERRIPIQYAKRVVGRKMYGGQNSHIPIRVNMSGVMPIIFSSSILMLPTMILSFWTDTDHWFYKILTLFSTQGAFYALIYFGLIIAFAYFYVTIQYNPTEMANNLRQNSGSIPGIRPGSPTATFIQKILSRVTLLGALCLSVVAVLPILVSIVANVNLSLGGTSVLILVGVALDTVKNIESQMMMRHYKGFLD